MGEILKRTGGNDWHMTGETSSKELGLLHQGKIPEMSYLYRTSHECRSNEQRMQIYHLMIDVRHEAAIQEAKAARECGKTGRGRRKTDRSGRKTDGSRRKTDRNRGKADGNGGGRT